MNFSYVLGATALAALFTSASQANPIVYDGTISGSGTYTGSVAAESYDPWATTAVNWSFWTFAAPFFEEVRIQVTPSSADFDVIYGVWYGTESDTADYTSLGTGTLNSVFVGTGDGSNPWNIGAGVPASLSFVNLYGSGRFTLAIADYADGLGSGDLPYTIAISVPEPAGLALMLSGIGVVGFAARRRAARISGPRR